MITANQSGVQGKVASSSHDHHIILFNASCQKLPRRNTAAAETEEMPFLRCSGRSDLTAIAITARCRRKK